MCLWIAFIVEDCEAYLTRAGSPLKKASQDREDLLIALWLRLFFGIILPVEDNVDTKDGT